MQTVIDKQNSLPVDFQFSNIPPSHYHFYFFDQLLLLTANMSFNNLYRTVIQNP